MKHSVEAVRVYCRDCYRAVAFVGNGCFCRGRMERVCAGERYGHPIAFCKGYYLNKADVKRAKHRAGESFVFRGVAYEVVARADFAAHCKECDLSRWCARDPKEVDDAVGLCRGLIFKKKN